MTPQAVQQLLAAGIVHYRSGRLGEAAACVGRARVAAPRLFEANYLAGAIAVERGHYAEAEPLLAKAAQINPKSAPCAQALGAALARLGRFSEAETAVHRALALQPDLAEAWDNLGYILKAQGNLAAAVAHHRRAVAVKPAYALGWHNLGLALLHAGQPAEALTCQERALALQPQLTKAHYGRALALQQSHRIAEAVAAYDRVLAAEPGHLAARSYRLMALNYLPEWSPEALDREHREFGRRAGTGPLVEPVARGGVDRPLRVAFLSPDLRTHSVAYFLEPILAHLDATQFAVLLYHDHFTEDETSARLRTHARLWRNFVGLPDAAVERTIRQDAPDILVDLAGHTGMNRLALLARRMAPVQISYLGYPNTTGLESMDFRFVDAITDPVGAADALHTETLVRFADTAWAYAPPPTAPSPQPPSGAPRGTVTFGCFNNPSKISDALLTAWSRLLAMMPGSRLRLKGIGLNETAQGTPWCERLGRAQIDPDRVELLGRTASLDEHLALYHEVDVALDTYPYHGTTTTCEALWMGVPVVSLAGDRHASRVGASLLTAAGHPDWIAEDWSEYITIAARLARQPEALARFRSVLREDLRRGPLLDHAGQARRFGEALRECWRSKCVAVALTES